MEIINIDTPFIFLPSFAIDKSKLFETICYEDGNFFYLDYHQKRINKTFQKLFNQEVNVHLKQLKNEKFNKEGKYRVKVAYSKKGIESIGFFKYKIKKIKKVALVEVGTFDYQFKYLDRSFFNALFEEFKGIDEFILLKNGYISDFTIGNIALFNDFWVSPKDFLLEGTTLKRLVQNKNLILKKIHFSNLQKYSKIALLNAMVGFYIIDNGGLSNE